MPDQPINHFYAPVYDFFMVVLVGTVSRRYVRIEACHRNQSDKSKLLCITCYYNNCLKQVTTWSTSIIKGGCGIHVSMHLKEELAWAIDEMS